ncbi:hypothetical protein A2617_01510 [Candidatus Daviesbacteria bacterium RIFOXYD1_FULL_41_10]|uniref:Peptidase MA-like domain-containing protein n=2 Tax=Candidatus Daviesiibacteriota TaxID=1752718 RepID=A0A1F5MZG2_9BACT|nr:MAG: hypothetical protein UU67_C0022G0003 [Candidatus Daviesbacteria bacterium GW2011_GWB1_41_5]OGE70744.1 MAG: hypothetical protein A2617_01510 [Candidatus Daviesbacteria bacterium RIFOXYD1_FULL_41_10]HBR20184.1 hypothetical protein [Phycisphaerales bacterium]
MDSNFKITHFDPNIDSEESLREAVEKAYATNREFFGQDMEIRVNFLYTREEMDQLLNQKTAGWVVGNTVNSEVNIFSPEVFDKVSPHPKTNFPFTLAHEMAHLFIQKVCGSRYPKWLMEGLPGQVAGQYQNKKLAKEQVRDFATLHTPRDWDNKPGYYQAFLFTHYLFEHFGKEQLLGFYKSLKWNNSYDEFKEEFAKKFGASFDDCQKDWVATLEDENAKMTA